MGGLISNGIVDVYSLVIPVANGSRIIIDHGWLYVDTLEFTSNNAKYNGQNIRLELKPAVNGGAVLLIRTGMLHTCSTAPGTPAIILTQNQFFSFLNMILSNIAPNERSEITNTPLVRQVSSMNTNSLSLPAFPLTENASMIMQNSGNTMNRNLSTTSNTNVGRKRVRFHL